MLKAFEVYFLFWSFPYTTNNFRIFAESGSSSAFGCFITSFVQLVRKADGFRNDFFAFDQRFLEAQTIFLQAVFFVVIVLVQMFHFWCFLCAQTPARPLPIPLSVRGQKRSLNRDFVPFNYHVFIFSLRFLEHGEIFLFLVKNKKCGSASLWEVSRDLYNSF